MPILFERDSSRSSPRNGAGARSRFGHRVPIIESWYYAWMVRAAVAKLQLGAYEQAVARFRRSIEANRNFPLAFFWLASALARLDRLDEARSAVKAGLALNPAFTISRARAIWTGMSDDPAYVAQLEPILDGLRKAGAPKSDRLHLP